MSDMKTKIVIAKGWMIIKEYDFLITLTEKDVVEYEGIEYTVDCSMLDIRSDTMLILIKE